MAQLVKILNLKGLGSLGDAFDPHGKPTDFELEVAEVIEPPEPGPLIEGNEDLAKALRRRPPGIQGPKWTRKDERQFEAIRDSCMAKKPRCTTVRTSTGRKRKCARECERIAAATVNKHRKADGRAAPRKKRKRR